MIYTPRLLSSVRAVQTNVLAEEILVPLDMHYHHTYAMAPVAGFKPTSARIIGTCAQFVDDNVMSVTLEPRDAVLRVPVMRQTQQAAYRYTAKCRARTPNQQSYASNHLGFDSFALIRPLGT